MVPLSERRRFQSGSSSSESMRLEGICAAGYREDGRDCRMLEHALLTECPEDSKDTMERKSGSATIGQASMPVTFGSLDAVE